MTSKCNNDEKIIIGNFTLDNNKWGNSSATQCIFTNIDGSFGFNWNNSNSGWNYPEVWVGTPRNCGTNNWNKFPIKYNDLNTASVKINYKFTKKPTPGTWWNLGYDIYWMDNTTTCNSGKMYNIMIWIHGTTNLIGDTFIKDVSDGYNTYGYYKGTRNGIPWHVFILKSRTNIPYEPTLNQNYEININIKSLMTNVTSLNGSWYIPGFELGCENSASKGTTSGEITINSYEVEINGTKITTPPPSICSQITCSFSIN